MLIDRTHRPWITGTLIVLVASLVAYVVYAIVSVRGAMGGSAGGIVFGSVGSALMLFAGLLGARKRVPTWRIGRGTTWMRGHLWLGLLSFPLILFHSGFRFGGGSLTRTLMILFVVVIVSGVAGAVIQEFIPRMMTRTVPMETIYEQIDHVREQLVEEAQTAVVDICGALEGDLARAGELERATAASAGTRGGLTFASGLAADMRVSATIREFFQTQVKPYLERSGKHGSALAKEDNARGMFRDLRVLIPNALWPRLADLENICDEKRQLDRQRRMHHLLHGWLFVHVPLSYAILVLGAIHAVLALRY